MPRFRVTIVNTADRAEQVRLATRVLHSMTQLPVHLDPLHPLRGIHRDEQKRAYLELATTDLERVREVLRGEGHGAYTELTEPAGSLGEPCENCGNIAGPVQPPVCPNCGFQEITPCPICGQLHSRASYENEAGNLFLCPTTQDGLRHRVRLAFNEPMFRVDGTYNQPLIVVRGAVGR